jgi:hypothetical protein
MTSQVLRRLTKAQLLEALRQLTAAPFHIIMWDNSPVRLSEALTRLHQDPDDAHYYASPGHVFSIQP